MAEWEKAWFWLSELKSSPWCQLAVDLEKILDLSKTPFSFMKMEGVIVAKVTLVKPA